MTAALLHAVVLTSFASTLGLRSKPIVKDDSASSWRSWGTYKPAKQAQSPPLSKAAAESSTPSSSSPSGSPAAEDVVLIDAGSSGSKVFAFSPDKSVAKLLTRCTDSHRKEGKTLQGIASLSYDKSACEWQIGTEELTTLAQQSPDYADTLLQLLASTYQSGSGKKNIKQVKNRDAVPMLATAGMRLISQNDNDKVWGYLCGKQHAGLTLAAAGEKCGTVPGTTEAYFEFLANAVNGKSRTLTGTFTVGGASSQIAIPLKTQDDVEAFQRTKQSIFEEIDCTKLRLASGDQAPIFNTKKPGGPTKECIDDYITYRPSSEIVAQAETQEESIRLAEIQGVGLISFLGLEGRGSFVAGGVNQIQNWATREGCNTHEVKFHDCDKKLRKALSNDIMWKHVTAYFQNSSLNVNEFSYNTPAAIPEMQGLKQVDGHDQGHELEDAVAAKCKEDNSVLFGYKDSVTCMKALYTSLYVTSFFHREGSGHKISELNFDPKRDWAEGMVEIARAFIQDDKGTGAIASRSSQLRRHSDDSFAQGARIHFASMGM